MNKKKYQWLTANSKKQGRWDLRFKEIIGSIVDSGIFSAAASMISWKLKYTSENVPTPETIEEQLPIKKPDFKYLAKDKISYTWIGHSTAVISIGLDFNILIDPVFADRCSPSQWVGPLRHRMPACQIRDLPKIDVVMISHDHYDHWDQTANQQLDRLFKPTFIAGLGSDDILPLGSNYKLLNWTDSTQITKNGSNYKITFVPVCHWSRRGALDAGQRLWGGFVVQLPSKQKIFYSGDTGYCDVFKEIGQQFGQFDLSILPIGAYEPRQYLKNQHVNPAEAVQIHKDIRSKLSVGVHWGTFPLGYQHYLAPRKDLQKKLREQQLSLDKFVAPGHGQYVQVDLNI